MLAELTATFNSRHAYLDIWAGSRPVAVLEAASDSEGEIAEETTDA